MNARLTATAALGLLILAGLASTVLPAEPNEARQATWPSGPMVLVLEEFDGVHPNGKWEIHQYPGTFEYHVRPDSLVMIDQRNANQHVTRRDLLLDPKRRYAIEVSFRIHDRTIERPPNSFCVNFNVAGPEDSLDSISCWSMNVDLARARGAGGVMKHMGFLKGRFNEIGQRRVAWSRPEVEYLMRIEVNTDLQGEFQLKTLTVTVMEGEAQRERFEVDYSSFPYQPDFTKPVRIGVNSHGADWTMRNLKVYAETTAIPSKKESQR